MIFDAVDSRTTLMTTGLGDKERLLGKMSSAINSQHLIGKKTGKSILGGGENRCKGK